MKQILIIEDEADEYYNLIIGLSFLFSPLTLEEAIASYPNVDTKGVTLEDLRKHFFSQSLYQRALEKLKGKVLCERVGFIADVKKRYKKTKFDVIVLDDYLFDGSTEELFRLFTNKDIVLPYSSIRSFLNKAKEFGFQNIFYKEGTVDIEQFPIVRKIFEIITKPESS